MVDENKELKPGDEGYVDPKDEGKKDQEDGDELTPEQIKEIQSENQRLKSTNTRLEGESKENKKKYQQKVADEAKAERERLEKKGDTEALLKSERAEKERYKNELVDTKTKTIRTKIENEILKLAPNCHDVEDVITNLDASKYTVDAENETVSGIKDALADVQKRKPYLFSMKKMPNSYNGGPGNEELNDGNPDNKNKKKVITLKEYQNLPNKKAMQDALAEGRVEGLNAG